jgi:hypothetical protein
MKNIFKIIFLAFVSFLIVNVSYAEKYKGEVNKPKTIKQTKAEPCKPATGSTDLDVNNVRTRINTGGDMWWDFTQAKYEIPKGSRKTSMFAAALWIGGLDINKQLKLAAQRFRSGGVDFWTGPLTVNGTAAVDAETCNEWDRHFKITRREVEEFIADPTKKTKVIEEWPWQGRADKGQTNYLAPFFDKDGDYVYNYDNGDYPYYDLNNSLCPTNPDKKNPDGTWKPLEKTFETERGNGNPRVKGGILVDQVLKGDLTLWWVFNDKGNIHSESNGDPIGLEIRAQAFGFSTNDEINNMTFYTYEIINRSTYTLTETYFSQWVDTDLGYAFDDYVGCDVKRGLGYSYNGRASDGAGQYYAYEGNPPAIGVDFFQGPYMDPDQIDNPKYNAAGNQICDVSINGVNFGNGIIDDERFGMRRFLYYNNSSGPTGEPDAAMDYYNLLKGIWKDNRKMTYGGDGHGSGNLTTSIAADFMFPGDSDPWQWGTGCGADPVPGKLWTEETANNAPADRRFMQSAGPFTLKPGAVNYITVGIPWAKATYGGPMASVELLRVVDDKCQALFDNCFKVLDGPDAPDLFVKELDKELILYITNVKGSNNFNESYKELDVRIPETEIKKTIKTDTTISQSGDTTYHMIITKTDTIEFDRFYKFEGYQIYQLRDATVSIADIENLDKARIVQQCDMKNVDSQGNGIGQLINYKKSDALAGSLVPIEKVNGANVGISHSFKILEDQFATGDKRLVNHKKYYFIAIAYAYNNYKTYNQSSAESLDGQKEPYLAGRKSRIGEIRSITAIPHQPVPEASGTKINAVYGSTPKIKRIEGQGNGGLTLDLVQASIDELMSKTSPPYIVENPVYENNKGPINVKVIDPLNVKPGNFIIKFQPTSLTDTINDAMWTVFIENNGVWDTIVKSDVGIKIANEQIISNLGISISIGQVLDLATPIVGTNTKGNIVRDDGFIEASIKFADSNKQWLFGVPDNDGSDLKAFNWIRSGSVSSGDDIPTDEAEKEIEDYYYMGDDPTHPGEHRKNFLDGKEQYEKILNGTWTPYRFSSVWDNGPAYPRKNPFGPSLTANQINNLASVDIVFTSDKSKWTRCPVIEMSDDPVLVNQVAKFSLRADASRNKNGEVDATEDYPTGMSWFPGYAINVETGERLNIMFGEDSWQSGNNGKDMKWNPTSTFFDPNSYKIIFGGKHYVYIMGHNSNITGGNNYNSPAYDKGKWAYEMLKLGNNNLGAVYSNVMWVGMPMVYGSYKFDDPSNIPTDAKIRLRVQKPYKRFYATKTDTATIRQNNNYPMYQFNTDDLATEKGVLSLAQSALDLIGVVPNPYYAYSNYEANQLDNRVRIINLPQKCTVTIYTLNGTLIRQFKVDKEGVVAGGGEALTSIDWDLKNYANIPISGGIYLIHVQADGVGEKIVKWFGALRPTDLNSF